VAENPALETVRPVSRFFLDRTTVARPESGMDATIYRPLATLSFALDRAAWGPSPAAARAENLMLHALNGFLVYLVLLALFGLTPAAALAGALVFVVHPAQVESAVWVTQRSNLLCLAGAVGTLILWGGRPGAGRLLGGAAAYAFALLSKETAAVVPLLLFLLDLARDGRGWRHLFGKARTYAAAVALTAGYVALRWAVVGPLGQRAYRGEGPVDNLAVGLVSWWEYARLILFPARLTVSHDQFVSPAAFGPWPWLGLAALLLWLGAAAFLWRRVAPRAGAALVWVPAALLPVSGLFPTDTFVAERFLYLPLVGVGALAGWVYDAAAERRATRRLIGVWVVALAVAAGVRTGVWRSELTLWQSAAAVEPENGFARACLAQALQEAGMRTAAEENYVAALRAGVTEETAFGCLNNLADLRNRTGDPAGALDAADKALALRPGARPALLHRVVALAILRRKTDAAAAIDEAERLHPGPEWDVLRVKLKRR
jgi:tetratricopeptide (TPR) repeat protein